MYNHVLLSYTQIIFHFGKPFIVLSLKPFEATGSSADLKKDQ